MKNKIITCFVFFTALFTQAQTTDVTFLRQLKDSCKFYFSGEFHSNTSYESRYELLTTLYTNNNVRVLILEAPKEFEFDFNKYVTTGDTDTYNIRLYHNYIRDASRLEFDDYLKKIKEFNQQIKDPAEKITILCADINYNLANALYKLSLITRPGFTTDVDIIKNLNEANKIGLFADPNKHQQSRMELAGELKYLLDMRQQAWQDLYQKNYNAVKTAIHALYRNTEIYYKYGTMSLPVREEVIYENILEAYNDNPEVSYYGNFGQLHTLLNCNPANVVHSMWVFPSSMANELNKTPELENKVCSMPYYYLSDTKTFMVDGKKMEDINFLTDEEKEKYKKQFDAEKKRIYVPINKLQKTDELDGMFNYLIISK